MRALLANPEDSRPDLNPCSFQLGSSRLKILYSNIGKAGHNQRKYIYHVADLQLRMGPGSGSVTDLRTRIQIRNTAWNNNKKNLQD
jgi:hypothetical protein